MLPKPLSFKPNGSLKLTPSTEKSLKRSCAPITVIELFLLLSVLILTLGSNFAKSAIDRLIVGTPAIASSPSEIPPPILIVPLVAEAVTPISSILLETMVISIAAVLFNTKYNPD